MWAGVLWEGVPGKERQPSASTSVASLVATILGLTSATSLGHFLGSPSGLKTMIRLLMPTWGAARPTPLQAYMTRKSSFTVCTWCKVMG